MYGGLMAWERPSQALFSFLPAPESARMLGLSGGLETVGSLSTVQAGPCAAAGALQMEAAAGSPEISALT